MKAATRRQAETLIAALEQQGPTAALCLELGSLLERQGDWPGALACLRQALEAEPGNAEIAFRLGNLLMRAGLTEEAASRYSQAVTLRPQFAEAWFNLGVARSMRQELVAAMHCYERAIRARPAYADAHNNLGILLHGAGRVAEAMSAYEAALEADPHYVSARYNRAQLHQQTGALGEAERDYRRVIREDAGHADAHNNLGNVLLAAGRAEEARRSFRRALEHKPEHPEARWNLGCADLLTGRFREGWRGYEHRFAQFRGGARHRQLPRWQGEPLNGRRLLVWAEQGLGDTIQMVRWVAPVLARGGPVVLECHRPLVPLLAGMSGLAAVVAIGDPLPPADLEVPLMSLPGLLGVDLKSLPGPFPYLAPAPELVADWRHWLDPHPRPWIGVAWAGNARFERDQSRSISPAEWSPLVTGPGTFFSVRPDAVPMPGVLPLAGRLTDFHQTAALMANLDLIVSVDTAAAHLAGALGRPVWTLIPAAPDWRWLLDRADSPWYPTMRLFRQPARGKWQPVIAALGEELARFSAESFSLPVGRVPLADSELSARGPAETGLVLPEPA